MSSKHTDTQSLHLCTITQTESQMWIQKNCYLVKKVTSASAADIGNVEYAGKLNGARLSSPYVGVRMGNTFTLDR